MREHCNNTAWLRFGNHILPLPLSVTRSACCLAMYDAPHHLVSYIFLVLPALLSGFVLMSLQKTPLGCRETHSGLSQLGGYSMVLNSTMNSCKVSQRSLICITLPQRNMQISTCLELMHRERNCWCVPRFAFRSVHKHRDISAALSSETHTLPWYTQYEISLFGQFILTEPWWVLGRYPCSDPRVT